MLAGKRRYYSLRQDNDLIVCVWYVCAWHCFWINDGGRERFTRKWRIHHRFVTDCVPGQTCLFILDQAVQGRRTGISRVLFSSLRNHWLADLHTRAAIFCFVSSFCVVLRALHSPFRLLYFSFRGSDQSNALAEETVQILMDVDFRFFVEGESIDGPYCK